MKKLLAAAAAAGIVLGGFAGTANAIIVTTPNGSSVGVNEGNYIVYADGSASSPGASSGFVSVSKSGQVCADDNGSPDNGDATPDSSSPSCTP